jgi:hypothetical protein
VKFQDASPENIRKIVVFMFWDCLCTDKESMNDKEWALTASDDNLPYMLEQLARFHFTQNGNVEGSDSSWTLVRESLNYLDKEGVYYYTKPVWDLNE